MTTITFNTAPLMAAAASKLQSDRAPDGASHVAMIKRFTSFVVGLVTIVLVVAAVGAVKFAVFFPRFVH